MALEVGSVLEGKISGITKFGAFVDLPDGSTGMVHISEVAPTFVNEIKDFVTEGQTVKVKVISLGENGKISLSIKQAIEKKKQPERTNFKRSKAPAPKVTSPGDFEWRSQKTTNTSFEDMMQRFKQTSEDKMAGLKQHGANGRGGSRRGNGNGRK